MNCGVCNWFCAEFEFTKHNNHLLYLQWLENNNKNCAPIPLRYRFRPQTCAHFRESAGRLLVASYVIVATFDHFT